MLVKRKQTIRYAIMPAATQRFSFQNSSAPPLYYRGYRARGSLERYTFDKDYVDRLTQGDAETESHFSRYFGEMLFIKLRSRLRSPELVEDACQDTLFRVLNQLRKKGGIEFPERLGAYVHSVSEHVVLEFYRAGNRFQQVPENATEPVDRAASAETRFINEECKSMIRKVLPTLNVDDREVLKRVFLNEQDKDEICRALSINRDYLRVRVHRALARFRDALEGNNRKLGNKVAG